MKFTEPYQVIYQTKQHYMNNTQKAMKIAFHSNIVYFNIILSAK